MTVDRRVDSTIFTSPPPRISYDLITMDVVMSYAGREKRACEDVYRISHSLRDR